MKEKRLTKKEEGLCDNCSNPLEENGLKFRLILVFVIKPLNFCKKECRAIFIEKNNIKITY